MELGSNFELDISNLVKQKDTIFEYLNEFNSIYTDSGRSAIKLLNRVIPCGKILLPSYICESVINVYEKEYEIIFYQLKDDFSVDVEDVDKKLDGTVVVFYLMHYFGAVQPKEILSFLEKRREEHDFIIIEDTTHSIMTQKRTIGDYCVCSLRKWFAITDGGVLYSTRALPEGVEKKYCRKGIGENLAAMIMKFYYINYGVECNDIYREVFIREEEKLDRQDEIFLLSEISGELLKYYSISEIISKRISNYQLLKNELPSDTISTVCCESDFVPFVFPIFISCRNKFRKKLMEKKIYCAVHWPIQNEILQRDKSVMEISESIISLPIDQRYGKEHMKYLIDAVLESKNGDC